MFYFGTKEVQYTAEGEVVEIDEYFIHIKKEDGMPFAIDLDDLRSVELRGENSIPTSTSRIMRQFVTLNVTEAYNFDPEYWLKVLKGKIRQLTAENLKNELYGVFESMTAARRGRSLNYKAHDLCAKVLQLWEDCTCSEGFEACYLFLGLVGTLAEKYEDAVEPLVRCRQYRLAAYAAEKAKLTDYYQTLMICALLNHEPVEIDQGISEICISRRDSDVLRALLSIYRDDKNQSERIASCAYMLFQESKGKLASDITLYFSASEAAEKLLTSIPEEWKKESTILQRWEEYSQYTYPSTEDTDDLKEDASVKVGRICQFNSAKRYGRISPSHYFYIEQVLNYNQSDLLLRYMLRVGLWDQLEVQFRLGASPILPGMTAAYEIELTERGYNEAVRRLSQGNWQSGLTEAYWVAYRNGRIACNGRKYNFDMQSIADPYLRAYYNGCLFPKPQNVVFQIQGNKAVNVCWANPSERDRADYMYLVTDEDNREWRRFQDEIKCSDAHSAMPETDSYADTPYRELQEWVEEIEKDRPKALSWKKINTNEQECESETKQEAEHCNTGLDLRKKYVEGESFGILAICSNHSAKIFRVYEPGSVSDNAELAVLFNPEDVRFSTIKRPNTSKNVYLVRFRQEGETENTFTGVMHPTIAKGSVVTVIQQYRRNSVQSIVIAKDNKFMEVKLRSNDYAQEGPAAIQNVGHKFSQVSLPIEGETILANINEKMILCTCKEYDNEVCAISAAGVNLGAVDRLVNVIWRFGCVTEFRPEQGYALMNNTWLFDLNNAVPLINILKSQHDSSTASIGVYCIFSCLNGSIHEVRRLREVMDLIPWEKCMVTDANKATAQIQLLAGEQQLNHHSTVESNPYINRSFSRGTLTGSDLWMRRVYMAWRNRNSKILELHPEALALHSTAQRPMLRYVERTDSFEGYENQTEHFAVLGDKDTLMEYVGKPVDVVFTVTVDGLALECRLKNEQQFREDSLQENSYETVAVGSSFANSMLIRLYLRSADINQTGLREIDVDDTGMPRTAEEALSTFRKLFQPKFYYPSNWQNQLVAAKIAMAYPGTIPQINRVSEILMGVLRMRMRAVSRSSNAVYGELAYGLSLLMQYDTGLKNETDYHTWLLLQDLGTVDEIINYETSVKSGQAITMQQLCARSLPEGREGSLLAHLLYLDPVSLERMCSQLEHNEALTTALKDYAANVYDNVRRSDSLLSMVNRLRTAMHKAIGQYASDLADLCERRSDISDEVSRKTDIMAQRWLKLACSDDQDRFMRLKRACDRAQNYVNYRGFTQQEYELVDAWRTLDSLESECMNHPCRDSSEVLILNPYLDDELTVLKRLKQEISDKLSRLYREDSLPKIICELNEESIPLQHFNGVEAEIQLIIRNGDSRHMLQAAESVIIRLESLTPGIYVTTEIALPQRLAAGEEIHVPAYLHVDDEESLVSTDKIIIQWQAEFLYTAAFQNGRSQQSTYITGDTSELLMLQLVREQHEIKNMEAGNPYAEAAGGNPLPENSAVYRHRAEEDTILNSILIRDQDGNAEFRSGATVIVHGQKKSGKTSLINQIKAYIDGDEQLRKRAIIIDFDSMLSNIGNVGALSHFQQSFCDQILQRFDVQLEKHLELWDMMEENDLEIPDLLDDSSTAYARFSRFFNEFAKLDRGYHTVLLFMDEFTTLCTSLMTEINSAKARGDYAKVNFLQHIPDFIKDFSGKGFIQVVIGHEAMMRSLDTLGMSNQTKEFATTVEITALKPKEAEALIREPMRDAFGYDVYRTPLGASAVDYLQDITGCHPTFLVRACKEIFDYYLDPSRFPSSRTQLTKRDVEAAMERYVSRLQLSDFDILLVEDGDDVENPEERKTYRYLKTVAMLALNSHDHRTADTREASEKMRAILGAAEEERVRSILQSRHVIRYEEGGGIRIATGLFLDYIYQRNGGK